jgi:hypothetical protein
MKISGIKSPHKRNANMNETTYLALSKLQIQLQEFLTISFNNASRKGGKGQAESYNQGNL